MSPLRGSPAKLPDGGGCQVTGARKVPCVHCGRPLGLTVERGATWTELRKCRALDPSHLRPATDATRCRAEREVWEAERAEVAQWLARERSRVSGLGGTERGSLRRAHGRPVKPRGIASV